MRAARQPYPSDVRDGEWAFVAPNLTLLKENILQRKYDLREVLPWPALADSLGRAGTHGAA